MNRLSILYKRFLKERLFYQYVKIGFFHKALLQILVTGLSNKGLEILRLSANKQLYKYLKKNYYKYLDNSIDENIVIHSASNRVWVCWLQGIKEDTPPVVKRCIQSMYDNLKKEEVVLLTEDNYHEYVTLPDYIVKKYNQGKISKTHLTDFLRLELLIKYGGIWIDATVLCTDDIPNYILNSDLFLFQNLKPGRDGDTVALSSWFIVAKSNNRVLIATQKLMYEYWRRNEALIDYFLIHNFLRMSLDRYPEEDEKIIKYPNSTPHILLLDIFKPYDKRKWDAIKEMTPIHKLAYKRTKEDMDKKDTYYDVIINKGVI